MTELSLTTVAEFEARLGDSFTVEGSEPPVSLRLTEAKAVGSGQRDGGAFSVVFEAGEDVGLPQQIHRLSTADGAVELFLVPIGPFGSGFGYEAVFT